MAGEITLPTDAPKVPPAPTDLPPPLPDNSVKIGPGMIAVQTNTFEKVKSQARAAGQKDATEQMLAQAKALGFDSIDAAFAAAKEAKKVAEPPPTPPVPDKPATTVPPDDSVPSRYAAELAKANAIATEAQAKLDAAKLDAANAAAAAANTKHEADTKIWLIQNGVKEVDFAMHSLSTDLAAVAEGTQFDQTAWITKLRTEKPFLFSATPTPATSVASGTTPPTPTAAQLAGALHGGKHASQWTPEEVKAAQLKYGLSPTIGQ